MDDFQIPTAADSVIKLGAAINRKIGDRVPALAETLTRVAVRRGSQG
jgi:hypothetical protein